MIAASALDQVALSLRQAAKSGVNSIDIQLKPPALGAVDVKLEMTHDGRLTAVISADRSDTLLMLQRGSGELQQALRDAGIQTDSGSLSFNLRGDGQTGGQGNAGAGQSGLSRTTALDSTLPSDTPLTPIAAAALASTPSGRLNIQV